MPDNDIVHVSPGAGAPQKSGDNKGGNKGGNKIVRKRRAKGLSRDRIIAETLQYLRDHPDKQLTLARAGAAVGATSMAIYRHFRDGAELADAILAKALEGAGDAVDRNADWQIQVRGWIEDVYFRLVETRQCVDILASSRGNSIAWMRASTSLRHALTGSGLSGAAMEEAIFWITLSVSGFAQRALMTPLDQQIAGSLAALETLEAKDGADFSITKAEIPRIFTHALEIVVERTLASIAALVRENGAAEPVNPDRSAPGR